MYCVEDWNSEYARGLGLCTRFPFGRQTPQLGDVRTSGYVGVSTSKTKMRSQSNRGEHDLTTDHHRCWIGTKQEHTVHTRTHNVRVIGCLPVVCSSSSSLFNPGQFFDSKDLLPFSTPESTHPIVLVIQPRPAIAVFQLCAVRHPIEQYQR